MYYALVDCNNFYASCERLFRPELVGRPVIVLSNNDGCVIARSQEAKDLDISMGVPYFKIRELVNKEKVTVCSSNYALYGDLSARVMRVLEQAAPEVEVYSIDEAFMKLPSDDPEFLQDFCRKVRTRIRRWVGIPVGIGIAKSRTLAKGANKLAKHQSDGVYGLFSSAEVDAFNVSYPLDEVWGIGRGVLKRLKAQGIHSVKAFVQADESQIRRILGINGVKTQLELQQKDVITTETPPENRHSVMVSRSFGQPVYFLQDLKEAAVTFTTRACERLREMNLVTRSFSVYLRTNHYRQEQAYSGTRTIDLDKATNDSGWLSQLAAQLTESLFRPGLVYQKLGVCCQGLCDPQAFEMDLFGETSVAGRDELWQAVDRINRQFGKRSVFQGGSGIDQSWQMQRQFCSPHYTTDWDDLLKIKI